MLVPNVLIPSFEKHSWDSASTAVSNYCHKESKMQIHNKIKTNKNFVAQRFEEKWVIQANKQSTNMRIPKCKE